MDAFPNTVVTLKTHFVRVSKQFLKLAIVIVIGEVVGFLIKYCKDVFASIQTESRKRYLNGIVSQKNSSFRKKKSKYSAKHNKIS